MVGDDVRFVLASRNPDLLNNIKESNLQAKVDVSNRIRQKQIDAEVATHPISSKRKMAPMRQKKIRSSKLHCF